MAKAAVLSEIWRGPLAESVHEGHAVICEAGGDIVGAWGDPDALVLPRSSAKMLQALPLVESGAAEAFGLGTPQLALACASHNGAPIHTGPVAAWLAGLGLGEPDLRCGAHPAKDDDTRHAMRERHEAPCQLHNNCSGKHAGFLTLNRHLGGGAEYVDPAHPVQKACLEAFEAVTGQDSPGFGIDGCSAPNHMTTMQAMARAMARFAGAREGADTRQSAMVRLREAMMRHPELVAGEGRACTRLMRACSEPVALKTGAEGYFVAILPGRGLGVAVKIRDGATRAAECTITALLVRLGVLDPDHPAARTYLNAPIRNFRGIETGRIRAAEGLTGL